MLRLRGKPILTCFDMDDYFDLTEVMEQVREFADFAKGHLLFDETRRNCLSILEQVLSLDHIGPFTKPEQFWMDYQPKFILPATSSLIEECFAVYHTPENDRLFVLLAAVHILAGRKTVEEVTQKKKKEGHRKVLDLTKHPLVVGSGLEYECNICEISALSTGKMQTVMLACEKQNAGQSVIFIRHNGDKTEERFILEPGEKVYLNIIGEKLAAILPNQSEGLRVAAVRSHGNVLIDGKPCPELAKASSFAIRSNCEYIGISKGHLFGSKQVESRISMQSFRFYNLVEVYFDSEKDLFFFLRNDGIVLEEDGGVAEMQGRFVSIREALGKE